LLEKGKLTWVGKKRGKLSPSQPIKDNDDDDDEK